MVRHGGSSRRVKVAMSKFSETSFAKFGKFLAQQQPGLILLSGIDYMDQILSVFDSKSYFYPIY